MSDHGSDPMEEDIEVPAEHDSDYEDQPTLAVAGTSGTGKRALRSRKVDTAVAPASKSDSKGKKRKLDPSTEPKKRARRGKLYAFADLPLDIFSDICQELDLATLFALYCTNRQLRLVLKESTALWTNALTLSKLPTLSSTITTIGYAHLMFGTTCSMCGEPAKNAAPSYVWLVRLCDSCKAENLYTWEAAVEEADPKLTPDQMRHCIPSSYLLDDNYNRHYFWPDLCYVVENLKSLQSKESSSSSARYYSGSSQRRDTRQAEGASIERWIKQRKTDDFDRRCKERKQLIEARFEELGYDRELFSGYQWVHHKLFRIVKPVTPAVWEQIKTVLEPILKARLEEIKRQRAVDARKAEIEQRFVDLGYDAKLFKDYKWKNAYALESERPLTEAEFIRVQPELEQILLTLAREARKNVIGKAYAVYSKDDYLATQLSLYPLPPFAEFVALPSVEQLWQPDNAVFDSDDPFKDLIATIVIEIDELRSTFTRQAAAEIATFFTTANVEGFAPPDLNSPTEVDTFLGLKVCELTCYRCKTDISTLSALEHSCVDRYTREYGDGSRASFKFGTDLRFLSEPKRVLLRLLKVANLSPEEFDENTKDSVGGAFSCTSCRGTLGTVARTWSQMLQHLENKHVELTRHNVYGYSTPILEPGLVHLTTDAEILSAFRALSDAYCDSD